MLPLLQRSYTYIHAYNTFLFGRLLYLFKSESDRFRLHLSSSFTSTSSRLSITLKAFQKRTWLSAFGPQWFAGLLLDKLWFLERCSYGLIRKGASSGYSTSACLRPMILAEQTLSLKSVLGHFLHAGSRRIWQERKVSEASGRSERTVGEGGKESKRDRTRYGPAKSGTFLIENFYLKKRITWDTFDHSA